MIQQIILPEGPRRAVRAALRSLGESPGERTANALVAALVLLGLVLRARGYLFATRPLWWDESSWAMVLVEHRPADDAMRPIAFLAVSRALCWLFSPSETWLRALSWFSGIATVLVAPFLARRLFSETAARLLFVTVLALHPAVIDLSKEFKPYSESLALHVGLVFLTLRYCASRSLRDLFFVLGLGVVGMLFAQDIVFAYPGVFLVLGWQAWEQKKKHLRLVVLGAALVIAGLAAQYVLVWSAIPRSDSGYWGDKYGVFHDPNGPESFVRWFFAKYRELAEFPGYRRVYWSSSALSSATLEALRRVNGLLWLLAHVAGLFVLAARRRARDALLVVLPCVVFALFNALRFWPYGVFRANLFSLLYLAAIAAMAFDWPLGGRKKTLVSVLALALVLVPLVAFERDFHRTKRAMTSDGFLPQTLARIRALRGHDAESRREPLLLSAALCTQWQYYTEVHPGGRELERSMHALFQTHCVHEKELPEVIRRAARSSPRVWGVIKDPLSPELLTLDAADGTRFRVGRKNRVDTYRIVTFERRRSSR